MALWGISTTAETSANNYAIPKYVGNYSSATSQFEATDKTRSVYNTFADSRGWVYRHYGSSVHSGLSTSYFDEVLIPIAGLTTAGGGANTLGLGAPTPIAVFFEDPNLASPISVSAGGTTGISTNRVGQVHVVWNESLYCGVGATVLIRAFDANGLNETTAIVGVAASAFNSPAFSGQVTNRVSFAFTAPSTVLTADVPFLTTATAAGQTVAIGATTIFVSSVTNVSAGSSITITGKLTNAPVVSVGSSFVNIGAGSTIASTITAGIAATFSTRTRATQLRIDTAGGVVGVITDFSNTAAVKILTGLVKNIAGAGTTAGVGIGVTTLNVIP